MTENGGQVAAPEGKEQTTKSRESQCGIGGWRPKVLQRFNNPYVFVAFLSTYAFVYGYIKNGSHNANTTSYERRFHLTSEEVGWLSAASDIVSAILGTILCFYGAKQKLRFVTIGAFLGALGSFLMGVPHYTTGDYVWGQERDTLCSEKATDSCDESSRDKSTALHDYLWLLMFGYLLIGICGVTIMTFGMSAVDDMFPPETAPLYSGIILMVMYLGIGAGYMAGGQSLSLYVDFDFVNEDEVQLTPDDPRWVGAWWLSFLCAAFLLAIFGVVFCLFGQKMPRIQTPRGKLVRQLSRQMSDITVASLPDVVIGTMSSKRKKCLHELNVFFVMFYKALRRICTKPVFLCLSCGYMCTFLVIVSHSVFLPKLIQNQFNITDASAALYAGIVIIPSAGIGQFLGGLLVKKFQLTVRGCLLLTLILEVIAIPLLFVFFLSCDQPLVAGWNSPYGNSSTIKISDRNVFEATCNHDCHCDRNNYEPVCDQTGIQFFSPCFAGCSGVDSQDKSVFVNCTCSALTSGSDRVTSCKIGCNSIYGFLVLIFIGIVLLSVMFIPIQTAIFRITGEKDKTLAVGIMWAIVRLFGSTPGPIIMGAVIDATCVALGTKCGKVTSCWIYDNKEFGRNISLMSVAVLCLAALLYFIGFIFHQKERQSVCDTNLQGKGDNPNHKDDDFRKSKMITEDDIETKIPVEIIDPTNYADDLTDRTSIDTENVTSKGIFCISDNDHMTHF